MSSYYVAVDEAVNKVLSGPIRPHFAIAHVGPCFDLDVAHKLGVQLNFPTHLAARLGSTTPLITSVARGIMGIDAISNEFKEIKWDEFTPELGEEGYNLPANVNRGITLMVGFVPGLIVEAIPMIGSKELVWALEVDKFVTDVRNYTSSVSHTTSPAAMIMFGVRQYAPGLIHWLFLTHNVNGFQDPDADMRPVLDKMDRKRNQVVEENYLLRTVTQPKDWSPWFNCLGWSTHKVTTECFSFKASLDKRDSRIAYPCITLSIGAKKDIMK
ncbi:hypothetical protein RJ641_014185 [Dillenia turbinata]|uniref:Uncharacterized protein n=1 Tax=Dillenia turbinata TaxID=194707 RepID=A0AAN8Z151_9MAGN